MRTPHNISHPHQYRQGKLNKGWLVLKGRFINKKHRGKQAGAFGKQG